MARDGFDPMASAAAFDFARLAEVSGGDGQFERELSREYIGQSWTLLAQIAGALERRDGGTLRRSAHTLKGSSRTIGAEGVAVVAALLERIADEPDRSPAPGMLERARRSLTATEQVLDRYFGSDEYRRAA